MFIISVRSRSFAFACFIWIWLTCSENRWRARSGQPTVLTRDTNRRAYEKTWGRRILLSPVSPVFSVIVVSICPRLNVPIWRRRASQLRTDVLVGGSPTGLFLSSSSPRDVFPFRFMFIDHQFAKSF